MHMILIQLCFGYVLVIYQLILPISFRFTSLTPWQLYDCSSANEATLKNMG